MFATLPLLFFLLLFALFSIKSYSHASRFRASFLSASVVWGGLLFLVTEVLSTAHSISFGWLLTFWGIGVLVLVCICARLLYKSRPTFHNKRSRPSPLDLLVSLCIFFIVSVELLIALISPPNTWDSMSYHIGRVVHWIQNQSVAFYPTNIPRQLYQGPWAEFAVMHFQILSHGDRLANLIQWFSMIGSIVGVTLISKHLGANRGGQILSAVAAATIPMGILQASSTQTDYVVSFWLVCLVFYLIASQIQLHWSYVIAAGVSLGLALLTKATAYVYAFPFLVWWALSLLKKERLTSLKYILVLVAIALLMNLPHYARNFNLYDSPLGPGQENPVDGCKYTNDSFTIPAIISNVVRNMALHIGTPFPRINSYIERQIKRVLGSEANNPLTTYGQTTFYVRPTSFHEDTAGNLLHSVLIVSSLAIIALSPRMRSEQGLVCYSVALAISFFLFCVILRWQPFHSRLHLPLFVLFAPVVGITFSRIGGTKTAYSLVVVLILGAFPWVFMNDSRPLIGAENILNTSRIQQYFANRQDLMSPYIEATNFVIQRGCSDIGLSMGNDHWEYPFWVLLQKGDDKMLRIEHIEVQNVSERIPINNFTPCVIIETHGRDRQKIEIGQDVYSREWTQGDLRVYVKQ